jgi:hypothetical protein
MRGTKDNVGAGAVLTRAPRPHTVRRMWGAPRRLSDGGDLKPKVAEAAESDRGGSNTMWYVVGIVVALGGAIIVVLLRQRGGARAVAE